MADSVSDEEPDISKAGDNSKPVQKETETKHQDMVDNKNNQEIRETIVESEETAEQHLTMNFIDEALDYSDEITEDVDEPISNSDHDLGEKPSKNDEVQATASSTVAVEHDTEHIEIFACDELIVDDRCLSEKHLEFSENVAVISNQTEELCSRASTESPEHLQEETRNDITLTFKELQEYHHRITASLFKAQDSNTTKIADSARDEKLDISKADNDSKQVEMATEATQQDMVCDEISQDIQGTLAQSEETLKQYQTMALIDEELHYSDALSEDLGEPIINSDHDLGEKPSEDDEVQATAFSSVAVEYDTEHIVVFACEERVVGDMCLSDKHVEVSKNVAVISNQAEELCSGASTESPEHLQEEADLTPILKELQEDHGRITSSIDGLDRQPKEVELKPEALTEQSEVVPTLEERVAALEDFMKSERLRRKKRSERMIKLFIKLIG